MSDGVVGGGGSVAGRGGGGVYSGVYFVDISVKSFKCLTFLQKNLVKSDIISFQVVVGAELLWVVEVECNLLVEVELLWVVQVVEGQCIIVVEGVVV